MTAPLPLMTSKSAADGWISLSDPDLSEMELAAVDAVLRSPNLSRGVIVEQFEEAFAAYLGRRYAIAVSSGTMGLLLALTAKGIGPGDEVIASAHSYRETAHAIVLAGATPIFADIDYWAGTIASAKITDRITEKTSAIVAANTNGHPAPWPELRTLANQHQLVLIEDSTEAIGSRHSAGLVGTFGDMSVFDFAQPGIICCGEGGMVVTDDVDLAMTIRRHRLHRPEERGSVAVTMAAPFQAGMSDITAALGLAQLKRLDLLLERRRLIQNYYYHYVQSFEGIKDPYVAPDVEEVNWFLYVVHLGTRFTRSSRDAIIDDMRTEQVEVVAYSAPLHLQRRYFDLGWRKGDLFVTEKVADRAIALPFHAHLAEEQTAFIVARMKDASINVGAGAAIY